MRYFYSLTILILLLSSYTSFSQTGLIKGQVKNAADIAIPGVSVSLKNTNTSTTTNEDGYFSIYIPNLPSILVFSAIGYKIRELELKELDSLKPIVVQLDATDEALDEVVVVGYGAAKKKSVTGAVLSVRSERFLPAALEGRAAGISVGRSSKAIRIRGAATPGKKASSASIKDVTIKAAVSNRPSREGYTRILTAGELSDFKKWKLWEGYTKTEFKQWSEHWKIATKNRYCVQVQSQDRKGLAGEKVFLIDLYTRDTVWRAITDNTGKAELWAGFSDTNIDQGRFAILSGNQTNRYPTTFENGINRILLKKDCTHSNIANIAFVVDATGSMGDEISYLQEELKDIISKASINNKGIDLHLGSVFYRDRNDEYLTRSLDFQQDHSSLTSFIKNQSADGGGDYPEALEEALATALDSLHWNNNARSKIIFLILDAPPHDDAKEKMKELIIKSAMMGVRIVPVVCSGVDKSTEYLMRSIALATNGSYVFLTDDSGVGGKHIKPTTDHFKVELLNDLLQRLISEMVYTASCSNGEKLSEPITIDNNIAKVMVYPNPSRGKFEIRSTEKIKEIYLADFAGKILEKMETAGKNQLWKGDLSNYPSGSYLVKYLTEKKGWGAEKIVLLK